MARRVLVVDDHEYFRRSLAAFVSEFPGVEVMTAVDGRDAVETAARFRPDLVIMDIRMPRMNGLAAAARLRESGTRAEIVLYSMYGTEVEEEMPAVRCVAKEEVFDVVSAALLAGIR